LPLLISARPEIQCLPGQYNPSEHLSEFITRVRPPLVLLLTGEGEACRLRKHELMWRHAQAGTVVTTCVGLARTIFTYYTLYMTVHLVMFLPKITYIHRICTVLANPTYALAGVTDKMHLIKPRKCLGLMCRWLHASMYICKFVCLPVGAKYS